MLFEKIKLEADEKILKMVRKHWFIVLSELFGVVFIGLLPIIFLVVASGFRDQVSFVGLVLAGHGTFITLFITIWLLLSIMSGFMIWTNYYLDLWIITDRRIIFIDQIHFFNRNVAIFRLERLQDIEFSVNGLIPTFLNFGTLTAQTAGQSEANFKSTGMPDPRALQATIQTAMDSRLTTLHVNPNIHSG